MESQPDVLPMSLHEAKDLGIQKFDIILVTGDAYVDHPSFGISLIGRVLYDAGFSTGIISQPDWRRDDDFKKLGKPKLFFGVSSGNVDSMVNNYTANLKIRRDDVYSPGGHGGLRPNRATIVYADKLHSMFPDTPIVLGGIEASLRRFAHYDFWSDSIRQSILADAPADMLVFGMGEKQVVEIASRLAGGKNIRDITDIPGTAFKTEISRWSSYQYENYIELPGFSEILQDKRAYARAFSLHYLEQDPIRGRTVVQKHPKTMIIQNKPAMPLTSKELDHIYELPFSRKAHPSYRKPVPALAPVKFSITSHRGCFAACSFCALLHHQGRIIQSRSKASIVREARKMAAMPDFKGIIQDVGGPTANMYSMHCWHWNHEGVCSDKMCMDCRNLECSHRNQIELLRSLLEIKGVKKVYIGSGIRYDLVLRDSSEYFSRLCEHHISGHLKVAPEHITKHVTDIMHKPGKGTFEEFRKRFETENKKLKKKQYILPYFMSGHPGCTIENMIELAEYIRDNNLYTEQVQNFTPTPMTASTCMYYTGINPFTMEEVHVAKGREKRIQRALMHYRDEKNFRLVLEGLRTAGREDLIGKEKNCLIRNKLNL